MKNRLFAKPFSCFSALQKRGTIRRTSVAFGKKGLFFQKEKSRRSPFLQHSFHSLLCNDAPFPEENVCCGIEIEHFELISYFAPLIYTEFLLQFTGLQGMRAMKLYGPKTGCDYKQKIENLDEVLDNNYEIIGIDEVHMFDKNISETIQKLLRKNTKIIAIGLDTDYKDLIFPIIKKLFELGSEKVIHKKAVCEICRKHNAIYTQVFKNGKPILEGLPSVLSEDGTYIYKSVCRECFIKK